MITWVLYLCIGIIIGGMAGFYFAKLDDFSKKQKQALEDKLQKSERELVEYKDQVTSHFIETAKLINSMTESYQKVHEHLAHGSVQLCNNAIEVNKLTVSTEQLLPATSGEQFEDVVPVTRLADSEAPKVSTSENNNIKSETTIDSASAESIPSNSIPPHQEENPAAETPRDKASLDNIDKDKTESKAPSAQVTGPATETMAVAEEEESSENTKVPGSRMVH